MSVIMMKVVILSVIMMKVVMLSAMAPKRMNKRERIKDTNGRRKMTSFCAFLQQLSSIISENVSLSAKAIRSNSFIGVEKVKKTFTAASVLS
jgi:hypothetical protein